MIGEKFIAQNCKMEIVDYYEPNNGRSLWLANLFINKELRNNFFKNQANQLNFNLKQFVFCSPCNQYVFVPAEGECFILTISTLKADYLPFVLLSTAFFLGNYFYNNQLLIIYQNKYMTFHLDSKKTIVHNLDTKNTITSFSAKNNEITLQLDNAVHKIITL